MMGRMETGTVIEHVRHVAGVRGEGAAATEQLEDALRSVGRLEAWLAGTKAALTSKLGGAGVVPGEDDR